MNASTRRMKRTERALEKHQCFCKTTNKFKLAYDNIVPALDAASKMSTKYPHYNYNIYECGQCGMIHVGRVPNGSVMMMGGYAFKVEHGDVLDLAAL